VIEIEDKITTVLNWTL